MISFVGLVLPNKSINNTFDFIQNRFGDDGGLEQVL